MTPREPSPDRPRFVVDDDPDTVRHIASAVRPSYEVLTVPGAAALRQLEREWPDLVVLDPSAQGGEQLALAIRLRADIPIIALSRDPSAAAKIHALRSFAEDYVSKPFDVDELHARIDRVLHRMRVASRRRTCA